MQGRKNGADPCCCVRVGTRHRVSVVSVSCSFLCRMLNQHRLQVFSIKALSNRVLSFFFFFLNQGCCLRPKESVHVMKMSFELICCQPKGLVYRSSVCLDLAIVEPRFMTI